MTVRNRTIESNEELVRRIPTEVFDKGNVELVVRQLGPVEEV